MFAKALAAKGYGAITTELAPAVEFYFAEDYHQQYLAKNPAGYCGLGGTGVSCPIGVACNGLNFGVLRRVSTPFINHNRRKSDLFSFRGSESGAGMSRVLKVSLTIALAALALSGCMQRRGPVAYAPRYAPQYAQVAGRRAADCAGSLRSRYDGLRQGSGLSRRRPPLPSRHRRRNRLSPRAAAGRHRAARRAAAAASGRDLTSPAC